MRSGKLLERLQLAAIVCATFWCSESSLAFVMKPTSSRVSIADLKSPSSSRASSSSNDVSSSVETSYDLAVVGAGIVGVQAAMMAAQQTPQKPGMKVILIDAPRASGMLMNEATGEDLSLGAPTGLFSKALRDTSKRIKVSTLRGMGLREDSVWNEIISSCVDLASSNSQDIRRQLEMVGVTYLQGFARFPDTGETDQLLVKHDDGNVETIHAEKILIATGSKPSLPKGIPFDGKRVFDSDSINTLSFLPKSIAITGSGIIAVEYAKIFRNLGADVTLIIRDKVPRNALMKIGLDKDVSAVLVAALIRSGIKIEKGAQVCSFDIPEGDDDTKRIRVPIKLELEAKGGGKRPRGAITELRCDVYLAAVGRVPNTDGLNFNAAGIEVDEYGGILVDYQLCSTAPNVYAAGDVLGRPFLASTGVAQAQAAASVLAGSFDPLKQCAPDDEACIVGGVSQAGASFDPISLAANPFAFPTGVWTSPEAAYYGLTTEQAKKLDFDAEVGEAIALYAECVRGRVFSPNGLLKLVFLKPAGRIIGVHICGDDACELIHYGMELVKGRRTISDLTNSLFSAITYHELYKIAAQAAADEPGARKRRAAAGAAVAARNRQIRDQDDH
jgi:NAD(P) transhydrogenase